MPKRKDLIKKAVRKEVKLLIILIVALIAINYPAIDNLLEKFLNTSQQAHIERVIDGDTIVAENNNNSIRLLGINTPERGEFLYDEAKSFLEHLVLGENVTLEFTGDRYDKYNRLLAYVFLDGENVNVNMVENGFANYYFYSGRDKYSDELEEAWEICIENNINLCEKSDELCGKCVDIEENGGFIINNCTFQCSITNWQVRGEGREKFIFAEQTLAPGEKTYFALDISNTGGSLFLRDDKGGLVKWIA